MVLLEQLALQEQMVLMVLQDQQGLSVQQEILHQQALL